METKKKLSSDDFSSVVNDGSVGKVNNEPNAVVNDTGKTGGFDFENAVRSPYGMSALNNYLYDSGLQNVFKDYQENIASLNASEQQNLEDAYFIREMSKKYLGEYASNTGIGDVSGNLLDIYGNYQKSKADIKANYDALELNLTQEYRAEKTSLFNEKMKEQYDMELADFEEGSQEIMFNAVTGGYDTELYADEWEYLDAMKESGELSKDDYQKAYGAMYSSMIDRIQTNLKNENYEGFENSEEYINSFGKLIAGDKSMLQGISNQINKQNQITDIIKNLVTKNYGEGVEGLDYLESVRGVIGEERYQQHYAKIYADVYEEAFGLGEFDPETMTIDEYVQSYVDRGLSTAHAKDLRKGLAPMVENHEKAKIDKSIGNEYSEKYVGDDYNFNANTGGENVGKGSYMYQDANGVKSFAVLDDSEKDGSVSGWYASHGDVSATFRGENDGKNPKTDDEVEYSAYNEKTEETQTFTYVYQNGRWHRMVQENPINDTDMAQWYFEGGASNTNENAKGKGWEYDDGHIKKSFIFDFMAKDKDGPDTFTYGNKTYTQSSTDYSGKDLNDIKELFTKVHGSKDNAVVYFNNRFFVKTAGKIYEMKK